MKNIKSKSEYNSPTKKSKTMLFSNRILKNYYDYETSKEHSYFHKQTNQNIQTIRRKKNDNYSLFNKNNFTKSFSLKFDHQNNSLNLKNSKKNLQNVDNKVYSF